MAQPNTSLRLTPGLSMLMMLNLWMPI